MEEKKENNNWWQPYVMLFLRFSSWIGWPVIVGALVGSWADDKFNQGRPFYFFILIGLAFIVSMVGLVKEVGEAYRKIEEEEGRKQKADDRRQKKL